MLVKTNKSCMSGTNAKKYVQIFFFFFDILKALLYLCSLANFWFL